MTIITDEVLTSGNGASGVYVKLVNNTTSTIYAATGPTSAVGVWTATAPPGTYSEYSSLTGTGSPPGLGWTLFNSNYIVTDPVPLDSPTFTGAVTFTGDARFKSGDPWSDVKTWATTAPVFKAIPQ